MRGIVNIVLTFHFIVSALFGYGPFHYNIRNQRLEVAFYDFIYPIIVCASFLYFYPASLSIISNINVLVVIAFFYMTTITVFLTFLIQCLNAKKLSNFFNDFADLLFNLTKFYGPKAKFNYNRYVTLLLYKTVLISTISQSALIYCCINFTQMMTQKVDYLVVFVTSVAYFLQVLVPNMFYSIILVATIHYEQLNKEIKKVIDRISRVTENRSSNRRENRSQALLNLSQRLDNIAYYHCKLSEHTTRVNRIFSLQLLVSTSNFVGILLIEVE